MIDNSKDDIINNMEAAKFEVLDKLDNTRVEIISNLKLLKQENKAWFERLNDNQKLQIINQITLLRQQGNSNSLLVKLNEKADETEDAIVKTQIIAEYSEPLNNIGNIKRR